MGCLPLDFEMPFEHSLDCYDIRMTFTWPTPRFLSWCALATLGCCLALALGRSVGMNVFGNSLVGYGRPCDCSSPHGAGALSQGRSVAVPQRFFLYAHGVHTFGACAAELANR